MRHCTLAVEITLGALIGIAALVARFLLDPLLGSQQPFTPGFLACAVAACS